MRATTIKEGLRTFAFVALTYFVGGVIANTYLEWPAPMPDWLFYTTRFAIRVTGLGEVNNPDDAEVATTLIVDCISWMLTGVALWQLSRLVRRLRDRRKT
jgi:hypothetical protein